MNKKGNKILMAIIIVLGLILATKVLNFMFSGIVGVVLACLGIYLLINALSEKDDSMFS